MSLTIHFWRCGLPKRFVFGLISYSILQRCPASTYPNCPKWVRIIKVFAKMELSSQTYHKKHATFRYLWRGCLGFTYVSSAFSNSSGWMVQLEHHCITVNRKHPVIKSFDERISFVKSHSASCISMGEHSAGSLRNMYTHWLSASPFFQGKIRAVLKHQHEYKSRMTSTSKWDEMLHKKPWSELSQGKNENSTQGA